MLVSTLLLSWFLYIYWGWEKDESKILLKLAGYKRQLDYLRSPSLTEGSKDVDLDGVATASTVYDRHLKLIGEFYAEKRTLVPIEKLPGYVTRALIASEDRKYYQHSGIDYLSIFRAFLVNVFSLSYAQGGSTLTQQLSKLLFTNHEKTLRRKVYEYFCTQAVESHYTKKEILEMYLNLVYLGHENFGIESASQSYFGQTSSKLSLAEAALLIGILPNPKNYSPIEHLDNALIRQRRVLEAMSEMPFISKADIIKEIKQFKQKWDVKNIGDKFISNIGSFPDRDYRLNLAPFFLHHIKKKLLKKFSPQIINRGGLRIYTTLDFNRQLAARKALDAGIAKQKKYYENQLAKLHVKKSNLPLRNKITEAIRTLNATFVGIENKTGYITSMVGGQEFSTREPINRIYTMKRPTGSVIYPFYYYAGLSRKLISPASFLKNNTENISVRSALKKANKKAVYDLLKLTRLNEYRTVVTDLLHIPFIQVKKKIANIKSAAEGNIRFSSMQLAIMYATMINQGRRVVARDLLRVENQLGKILWEASEPPRDISILDPIASLITISMMQAIFEQGGIAQWINELRSKNPGFLPFDIAGYSGTSANYKDAWFVGLTSDEANVVWIGNDIHYSLGKGRTGKSIASPIWINYAKAARISNQPKRFAENWNLEGISVQDFCDDSGKLPRGEMLCPHIIKDQFFYQGSEPKVFCPIHLPEAPIIKEVH